MKAAQISEYGGPSQVVVNEVERPTLSEGQVLVEVHAASLNPYDTTVRSGRVKDQIPLTFPITLGGDIAGTVTQVAADVDTVKVGDKVYGQANVVAGNSGAFAEFAATKATQVAIMPNNIDFNQAASLPLVGVSALQAITKHLALQPGQKIFINGGAGGIGSIAVQIAKHIGAYVATTAAPEDKDYLTTLGADEIIDYTTQDFATLLHDFDALFDTVGGDLFNASLSILRRGGIAVSMIAHADEAHVKELGVTAISQFTKVTTPMLDQLTKLVEEGVVETRVGITFPLDQVKEAFEARELGSVHGKIVLTIR